MKRVKIMIKNHFKKNRMKVKMILHFQYKKIKNLMI